MEDPEQRRDSVAGYLLMSLVLLWSGALAVGFAWAVSTGELSGTRTVAFVGLSAFLALIAARTGFELARRVLTRG